MKKRKMEGGKKERKNKIRNKKDGEEVKIKNGKK
jgi:hypothetical protein